MNTPFEDFENLFLKVIATEGEEPFQWIYAVDDAWLHPDKWSLTLMEQECAPVFPLSIGTEVDASNAALQTALNGNGGGADDRETARQLVEFIQKRKNEGLNFGICFCSFEYFWSHITEINEPQNAVFFDLRHQMAANGHVDGNDEMAGLLRDAWMDNLASCSLLGDSGFQMSMLGWYLHYAFKLSCVNKMKFRHIANNHILIISSAISPRSDEQTDVPGTPRNAISQYLQIQTEIWKNLTPHKEGASELLQQTLDRLTPEDFTFSPLPKDFGPNQNQFQTGLLIFNNSFRNAANWDAIKKQWCEDIKAFYEYLPNGHYDSAALADTDAPNRFRWKSWFPVRDMKANITDPLLINMNYGNGVPAYYGKIKIDVLLKLLAHSGVQSFRNDWLEFKNRDVTLPSYPGFVFVFLLIEFAHSLAPHRGGNPASVTYSLDSESHPKEFTITFTLDEVGKNDLYHCYDQEVRPRAENRPVGTATTTLWALVKYRDSVAHLHKLPGNQTFGSLVTCNTQFCKDFPKLNWLDDGVYGVSISLAIS